MQDRDGVRSTKLGLPESPRRALLLAPMWPFSSSSVQHIGLCVIGNPNGERCGKTCVEERDNQWLGVSLSRQPKENGSIVVCINR